MRLVSVCALAAMFPICAVAQLNTQSQPSPFPQPPPRIAPQPAPAPSDTAQNTAALLKSNGGSLLRASLAAQPDPSAAKASQVSFFAVPPPTPRVLHKHDLVTIIVREESEAKSEGTTDLKKQADFDAQLQQFIKYSFSNHALVPAIGADIPEIKMQGNRDLKGEATVDRSDSLTLRVQAEVLDVKPNNTLVLQARANIKTDEEVETLTLSGVCRAEDITPDNTVLSTQLYDKSVAKTHTGMVHDNNKRGLLPRLFDLFPLF
jgi:flagellar L-ring protein precursor FlgH